MPTKSFLTLLRTQTNRGKLSLRYANFPGEEGRHACRKNQHLKSYFVTASRTPISDVNAKYLVLICINKSIGPNKR